MLIFKSSPIELHFYLLGVVFVFFRSLSHGELSYRGLAKISTLGGHLTLIFDFMEVLLNLGIALFVHATY